MSGSIFGNDLFSEFDRMQRQMASLIGGLPSSLRSGRLGAYPPINIGTTDDTIEVVVFAPGLRADQIDVSIDKGLLSISGERIAVRPEGEAEARAYAQERFSGKFRRVIELPQSADPDKVQARYTNGCLSISVGKREMSRPRAITVS